MFFKKIVFLTCFLSLFVIDARPELYIVKEVNGKDVSLDASDWDNYNGESGIYSILQKYQWPMSTVSNITPKERRKLYAEKPNAELNFIEGKIQKKFPDKHYKVMFIPTVVYELFAMLKILEKSDDSWINISKKLFQENKFEEFHNFLENEKHRKFVRDINELLYLAFMIGERFGDFPGFGNWIIDDEIKKVIHNKKKKKRKDIVAEIYKLYTNINNNDVTKKVHFLLNWYISNQMINTYSNKDFKEIAGNVINRIADLLLKNKISPVITIWSESVRWNLSSLGINEIENGLLKRNGVVAQTINLENSIQGKNAELIFRGIDLIEKVGKFDKKMHIASSLRAEKEPQSFNEIVAAYKKDNFIPFSISFNKSLFAGFFFDPMACTYNCMYAYNIYGYALNIQKLDYYIAGLGHRNDLFFIPPLNTLSSLFAKGEFFHARGKACIPSDPLKYEKSALGLLFTKFPDHSGLFLIQRDPLKHEKLFSKFVANNVTVLKVGENDSLAPGEREAILKKTQEESASFYGAIATLKPFAEKAKAHLNLSRDLKYYLINLQYTAYGNVTEKIPYCTAYGDVAGKILLPSKYQKREILLGFYDDKAFEKDASYNDLDWPANEKEMVREKLCTVKPPPLNKAQNSFRIMSFNVHNFHRICDSNKNLRKNPDYACATIATFSPDIALLQEIVPYTANVENAKKHTSLGPVSVNFTYLDKKMTELGFVENVKVNDFEFTSNNVFMGKAIFTKDNAKILDFSSNVLNLYHSDRGYARILFTYPKSDEKVLLYTVHLSFNAPESTKKEIAILMAIVEIEMGKFKTNNVIIMGDFNNSPYLNSDVFNALEKNKFTLLNDPTPTAFTQNHAGILLDLAWVSPGFLEKFEIKNDPGENGKGYKLAFPSDASDHWPIYIDFELKKKADPLLKALSLLKAKLLQLAQSLKKK